MAIVRNLVDAESFNLHAFLPFQLRLKDFELAMQDVYDFFVTVDDFRRNPRGELGTRTATLHRAGIEKLRGNWVYRLRQ